MTQETPNLSRRGLLVGLLALPAAAALATASATPATAQGGPDPADREVFKHLRETQKATHGTHRGRTRVIKKKKAFSRRRPTNRGVFSRGHDRFGAHSFNRLKKKRSFFIGRGR